eukprot:1136689-Pelagomonas_calceolata.AAC.1
MVRAFVAIFAAHICNPNTSDPSLDVALSCTQHCCADSTAMHTALTMHTALSCTRHKPCTGQCHAHCTVVHTALPCTRHGHAYGTNYVPGNAMHTTLLCTQHCHAHGTVVHCSVRKMNGTSQEGHEACSFIMMHCGVISCCVT